MEISVDKNGQIYVGKVAVTNEALAQVLPAQAETFPAEKVLLRGDCEATYGDVAKALARVSKLLPEKRVILVSNPQDNVGQNTLR